MRKLIAPLALGFGLLLAAPKAAHAIKIYYN